MRVATRNPVPHKKSQNIYTKRSVLPVVKSAIYEHDNADVENLTGAATFKNKKMLNSLKNVYIEFY